MDIYRDYFTREALVRSLAQAQYVPGRLGELGIFEAVPLNSTTMAIEVGVKDGPKVLTAMARGAPRQQENLDKRKVVTFGVSSYGDQGTVYADEVLNARGAGTSGAVEVLTDRRDRTVAKLRGTMDYTHEALRMTTLLAPTTTEFGSQGTEQTIAVQTSTTKTRQEIFNKIIKPVEAALDGIRYSRIRVLCSDGFWAELIENDQITKTYLNWQAAAELRGDVTQAFSYGNVMWERYRGDSNVAITANKAVVVPEGVQGFGFLGFAPNDTLESVGQGALGQPYYVGSKTLVDSQGTKGWEISIQSHAKPVIARPGATFLIKMS